MLTTAKGITRSVQCRFVLSLFLFGIGSHAQRAMAQSPGNFTATGTMTTSRFGHTSTLLMNGKVLIAGGSRQDFLASAELYDPSKGTFAATGSMITARSGHTATLLADGRVLITGGNGTGSGNNPLVSAELYDPSTGSFIATGDMFEAQFWQNATLLPNGKVLIARGLAVGPAPAREIIAAAAELYDPLSGTFAAAGAYAGKGTSCDFCVDAAPLLPDGNVMIIGEQQTELYNPITGTFSTTGAALLPGHMTASLLTNGKVLLAGGESDFGRSSGAEIYDPAFRIFTSTGNMACGRGWHTSTLLPDRTVLIAGGESESCTAGSLQNVFGSTDDAELYSTSSGTFQATGKMTTPREGHTATLLNDGTVLIAGGETWRSSANPPAYPAIAELYTPAVLIPAPVLLFSSGGEPKQGAILHADTHQVVSSSNPSVAGEPLEIYGTALVDGSVIPPQVAMGGRLADILFFGNAPGLSGLNQINVRVPAGVAAGPAVPVRLNYLGRPSNEVTIGVQ